MNVPRKSLVTVIPPDGEPGKCRLTNGTKVVLEDGTEVSGIVKVVLTAEVNKPWVAEITLHPNMGVMPGMLATMIEGKPVSWWRRMLVRIAGFQADVTALEHHSFRYRQP